MVLPFQDCLRDGGQDALTEIAAAVVHIKAGHWQNYPVAVIFLVDMVVGSKQNHAKSLLTIITQIFPVEKGVS